jgi:small neutral amino acid transporter SnatA (MarC family)
MAIAITLLLVTWAGPLLLRFFGVTVDTLRAAGGIVVLIIGLHVLFNKSEHKQTPDEVEERSTGRRSPSCRWPYRSSPVRARWQPCWSPCSSITR